MKTKGEYLKRNNVISTSSFKINIQNENELWFCVLASSKITVQYIILFITNLRNPIIPVNEIKILKVITNACSHINI
jgi:hypothetical protein